jgi:acyl-CoA synthetase (AMP-forming)/AMP-acid ligase II/uncharacterized membrane protein
MRVEAQCHIDAPREEIWEFITDPKNTPKYMEGLTRWDVEGEKDRGHGARYSMRWHIGSAEVGSLVEVVEYEEPDDMAWTSITGLDQRGRWRLRDADGSGTKVTLRLTYQSPGTSILALFADQVSSPMVKRNLERSLERLKAHFEGGGVDVSPEQSSVRGTVITSLDQAIHTVRTLAGAGLIRPVRPDRLVQALRALNKYGYTPAAGFAASAARYPDELAIIDESGTLTFQQVHIRTNALAHALADHGILEGDDVAIMARNHRGFIESVVALSKIGANSLFLNTAFAAPQLTEVVKREKAKAIIYDQEFGELLEDAGKQRKRFIAWHEDEDLDDPTLDELIDKGDKSEVVPAEQEGRVVILTSGTTGTPKGASRSQPETIGPAVSLLSRIPLQARERAMIAAPLFHSWGFAHFTLGMLLSSTYVLRRKFDPEGTLADIARYECTSCPVVPVMLSRILELPEETRSKYDTSSLRTVPVSGSALTGDLAIEFMNEFGEVIYNLYGSTEVAWASIATPEDLRAAPGTAGIPPKGTTLKIFDDDGRELPPGETGRIFVANEMLFEGYTTGGNKDVIDGLMATGDVGHVDEQGRLFVEGRDDEMIVSGGENVFPQEIEDLMSKHKNVSEVALIPVEDEKYGQRLKGFVVKKGSVSEDDLKKYVKSNLAGYKVPREIEFIDELPRNATGKVMKKELIEQEEEKASKGKGGGKSDQKKEKAGAKS